MQQATRPAVPWIPLSLGFQVERGNGKMAIIPVLTFRSQPTAPDNLHRTRLRGHAMRLHRDPGLRRDAGQHPRQQQGGLQGDLRGRGQRRQLHLDQRHPHLPGRHPRAFRPQRLQAGRQQPGRQYSRHFRLVTLVGQLIFGLGLLVHKYPFFKNNIGALLAIFS